MRNEWEWVKFTMHFGLLATWDFGRKFTLNSQLLEVFFFVFFNCPGNISQECNLTEGSKQ